MTEQQAQQRLKNDFVTISQAFEDLRANVFFYHEKKLEQVWELYRGNFEEYMPLFGTVNIISSESYAKASSSSFSHEEIISKLDSFIAYLRR